MLYKTIFFTKWPTVRYNCTPAAGTVFFNKDSSYTIFRFYDDIAQLLDDKFKTAYNLTYGTMGRLAAIDTSMFRRATWNYIQVGLDPPAFSSGKFEGFPPQNILENVELRGVHYICEYVY